MPGPSAARVALTDEPRAQLERLVRGHSTPQALLRRAQVILLAADGMTNAAIARELRCSDRFARTWRSRWAAKPEVPSLRDAPRSGRPPTITPQTRATLISLACERPDKDDKRPFELLWSQPRLQEALLARTGVEVSTSEIGRILRAREIRPHRVKLWRNSQDPKFGEKIDVVCGWYANHDPDVTVICVDEKRLFARRRRPALRPAGPNRPCRLDFAYSRHGSSVLLAGFDIRTGKVYAECRARRTGDDLVAFMDTIAQKVPGKVVIVWDNLNVHYDGKAKRWTTFNERHGGRFSFVYTPKHASWANQVEIWFSILERRVLQHGSFKAVSAVEAAVLAFIDVWNQEEGHPFNWTFRGTRDLRSRTRDDGVQPRQGRGGAAPAAAA